MRMYCARPPLIWCALSAGNSGTTSAIFASLSSSIASASALLMSCLVSSIDSSCDQSSQANEPSCVRAVCSVYIECQPRGQRYPSVQPPFLSSLLRRSDCAGITALFSRYLGVPQQMLPALSMYSILGSTGIVSSQHVRVRFSRRSGVSTASGPRSIQANPNLFTV